MTSRLKEDERNERTIRSLLKLRENRRCINCNSLGPQYVCINFWTFICTTCSGIHREFTHRVKSVSMAKFTSQEVSALQGGGNASAKEIYFKEWDPQCQSLPDSSNIERLRDFIRHVYVDKRFTREKSFDKPLSERLGLNGRSDERSSKNSNEEKRFENGKASDSQRYEGVTSPPIIRPVRDILGEKVSPIRVIEPPKANGPSRTQRSASSSSLPSLNRNPVAEVKTESSLIDFDAIPSTPQVPQIQQKPPFPTPFVSQPSTLPNSNWASFDSVQEVKTSHTPSNTNSLDALSELSVPALLPISHSTVSPGSSYGSHWQNVHLQQNLLPINQALVQSFNQVDVNSTAKKELPADLFTFNYSSFATPQYGTGFSTPPQYGMGFNMHYNVPVHMPPAYLQQSRPSNPFPSMVPLQEALPNMPPPYGIHHRTSSLGTPMPAWMPTQTSYPLSLSSQLPPHNQFMGQTFPNMPPQPRPQVGSFGSDHASFGFYNYDQQESRGNPFG